MSAVQTTDNAARPHTAPPTDRREERRRAIVDAAATLFAELSYADCDMERVAAATGVAKGTLYLYFPGKQELFFACVDRGMSRMQQAVADAASGAADPFDRIGRAVRAYLDFFERHPHYVELLIQERAIFKDRKRPTYFEYRDAARGPWRAMYAGMVFDGLLRDDIPVERMLDMLGNLLYGTMFTNHFAGRTASLDEQYRAILETVFRGLLRDDRRDTWTLPEATGASNG